MDNAHDLTQAIAESFARRLGRPGFAPDDDFFESGGASITAAMTVVDLRRAGVTVSVADVFHGRTPRAIASRIVDATASA